MVTAHDHAVGVSRGGCSTKIYLAIDFRGRPIAIDLTDGRHSDIKSVDALLATIGSCKRFRADRAYDTDAWRQKLRGNGTNPANPGKNRRNVKIRHDAEPTSSDGVSRRRFVGRRTFSGWPRAMINRHEHFPTQWR